MLWFFLIYLNSNWLTAEYVCCNIC